GPIENCHIPTLLSSQPFCHGSVGRYPRGMSCRGSFTAFRFEALATGMPAETEALTEYTVLKWTRLRTKRAKASRESAFGSKASRLSGQIPLKILGAESVREGGLPRDAARAHQVGQRLLHGHHAIGAAGGEQGAKLVVVALAHQRAHGVGGDHDFGGRPAVHSVHAGHQLLRDDGRQRQREL